MQTLFERLMPIKPIQGCRCLRASLCRKCGKEIYLLEWEPGLGLYSWTHLCLSSGIQMGMPFLV